MHNKGATVEADSIYLPTSLVLANDSLELRGPEGDMPLESSGAPLSFVADRLHHCGRFSTRPDYNYGRSALVGAMGRKLVCVNVRAVSFDLGTYALGL